MRRFARRGIAATVAAIALAATGTAASGTVYVMTAAPKPQRAAAPPGVPRPHTSATSATPVVPTTGRPSSFHRVVPPDFLIIAPHTVSDRSRHRIARLGSVRDVITVDAGQVRLQGGTVNMFAVDPARFRSWTPPGTARNDRLWNALAQDRFVVSGEVQRRLGLRSDMRYPIAGREQILATMGGSGSLGLPGINVLVDRTVGRRIGLVRDIALLVNAPGAPLGTLKTKMRRLVGARSQIVNLHDNTDRPARRGGAPAGRASSYLELYKQAATTCSGLSWTVLAAIGQIESSHGRNTGPSSAGALGPMQFMPATWKAYGIDGDHDGKADIMDPYDAVPTAARYLCANGAGRGGASLPRAVWHYNHSQVYVDSVLSLARAYDRRYS